MGTNRKTNQVLNQLTAGEKITYMPNLPQQYFGDIPADEMRDIIDGMEASRAVEESEDLFGEPISVYTRRQAIEDGVLVNLMQPETVGLVREAGFRFPVAMTIGAFCATVSEPDKPLPAGQDLQGRLWDVLWMLKLAIKSAEPGNDRVKFTVVVWDGKRRNKVSMWSLCGPGDNGEPVITIMLEGED